MLLFGLVLRLLDGFVFAVRPGLAVGSLFPLRSVLAELLVWFALDFFVSVGLATAVQSR